MRRGMQRPRDTQRSKIYAAERVLRMHTSFRAVPNLGDCQAFVNRVVGSAWTRKHFPYMPRRVLVTDGRARRRGGSFGGSIAMPRRTRMTYYLLHELAHEATRSARCGASHGRTYAKAYLALVRHFLGVDAHALLRAAFKLHGVKCTAKRAASGNAGNGAALIAWRERAAAGEVSV